jgi:nucleotide-binding universal stress UspA family protein
MTRIVLATDGGGPAMAAARVLDAVLRRDATVQVVAVDAAPRRMREEGARHAEEASRAAVEALAAAGWSADFVIRTGHDAAGEVLAVAEASDADLIAVGAGNHPWLERMLMGSVSTKILHHATTSVLVVHDVPTTVDPAPVVFGTDGSEGASAARECLIALLDPARVSVAVEAVAQVGFPSFSGPGVGYATSGFTPAIERELTAEAERAATEAAAALADAGFAATPSWEMGSASRRVLERMEELDGALAVVGSRGLGAFDRAVVGSVSDEVARHARATLVARKD